jgi:peptidoglycan/LPS O-acetylase OafA/YrhL
VSGGVDVFFVVAAYFMTASLSKRQPLGFAQIQNFYISTLRRVIPGVALVVLATVALGAALLPHSVWRAEILHGAASLLFVENWRLVRVNTDYLSQGMATSPFQQMWALSLQVQFYLALPIVIWACSRVAGRFSWASYRTLLLSAFTLVFFASFIWSVYETSTNQPRAYFDTFARAWEFAFGSILALTVDRFRIGHRLAKALGIAAMLMLLSFARIIEVSAQFPGYVALIPLLAAAAVIISAKNGGNIPVLNWKPVVRAGDYSFSFYLWHWPVLLFARIVLVRDDVGPWYGLAIIVVSAVLAYLTTHYFEGPFRRTPRLTGRPWLALAACVAAVIPAVGAIGTWYAYYQAETQTAHREVAAFLATGRIIDHRPGALLPDPIIVKQDLPPGYSDGCHQLTYRAALIECVYGNPNGRSVIVVVGGSHSVQWLPVLQRLAKTRDLKIVAMTKSACFFSSQIDPEEDPDRSCSRWNAAAMKRIIEISPDLVFTISTRDIGGREATPAGYFAAWRTLATHQIRVLALRDNPWFKRDVSYCVELHPSSPDSCGIKRADFYASRDPAAASKLANLWFADFSDEYCPNGFCSPAVDGILRYRDAHHLTVSYTMTLAPRLERELDLALPPD